jgi:ferredoxin-thioredoxin reductase catalytic subunit
MKNVKMNPNIEHCIAIMEGIIKKNGLCPCRVQLTEESKETDLCPCNEFMETSHCHCKLYVKIEG